MITGAAQCWHFGSSDFRVGRGEIEPAEVKEDRALEAVGVAVASGSVLDELNLAVQTFSGCVGNGNAQEGQDVSEMILEHLGDLDEWLKARMRCPEIPAFEMLECPGL